MQLRHAHAALAEDVLEPRKDLDHRLLPSPPDRNRATVPVKHQDRLRSGSGSNPSPSSQPEFRLRRRSASGRKSVLLHLFGRGGRETDRAAAGDESDSLSQRLGWRPVPPPRRPSDRSASPASPATGPPGGRHPRVGGADAVADRTPSPAQAADHHPGPARRRRIGSVMPPAGTVAPAGSSCREAGQGRMIGGRDTSDTEETNQ